MIVTFDFGIFPTTLFVSSELDFDKLEESYFNEAVKNCKKAESTVNQKSVITKVRKQILP